MKPALGVSAVKLRCIYLDFRSLQDFGSLLADFGASESCFRPARRPYEKGASAGVRQTRYASGVIIDLCRAGQVWSIDCRRRAALTGETLMNVKRRIRVQVADDHDVVIQGLHSILKDEADIELLLPPIRSGREFLAGVQTAQPDILLLDVQMPDFDMLSALRQLSDLFPRLRVIIITAQRGQQLVKSAAERGVAGYILKEEALSQLLPAAIRDVAAGETWFSPRASQQLLRAAAPAIQLSMYQLDILRLMVRGETPETIARALQRSVSAIYTAQAQLREKLGVETNEQAIVIAIRERLVPLALD
jgi:DNA-binding NarL/FixJ family response regulator